MYQRSFPELIGKKLNILLWVLIIFGSFCGIVSAWESGKELINGFTKENNKIEAAKNSD